MELRHLIPMNRSARQRALVDAALAAYCQWRQECAAVGGAYRRWVGARAIDEPFAFASYNAALDREEHAARRYARLIDRGTRLQATALARHSAQLHFAPWLF